MKIKGRVEGFVVNAYLLREASIFCSHYFALCVPRRRPPLPRNHDGGGDEQPDDNNEILDIFSYHVRHYRRFRNRMLSDEELHVAQTYILLNEDKIKHYIKFVRNICMTFNYNNHLVCNCYDRITYTCMILFITFIVTLKCY